MGEEWGRIIITRREQIRCSTDDSYSIKGAEMSHFSCLIFDKFAM